MVNGTGTKFNPTVHFFSNTVHFSPVKAVAESARSIIYREPISKTKFLLKRGVLSNLSRSRSSQSESLDVASAYVASGPRKEGAADREF
jgi:hypothetical protein